jgi:hypothetical protein
MSGAEGANPTLAAWGDGLTPPDAEGPMPEWTWSSPGGPYRP